ncbi:MAG: hypothetical protein V7L11_19550 [Nostoc sp.]|uniref:hypothetical protein n=1 Tax=Nostoc sp. TaxID=1180 RepID=UPI002FFBDD86
MYLIYQKSAVYWALGMGRGLVSYSLRSPVPSPQSPVPSPQSPIPNPQSPVPFIV